MTPIKTAEYAFTSYISMMVTGTTSILK